MIGGFRIIGGDKELFDKGYSEGLRECKEDLSEGRIEGLLEKQRERFFEYPPEEHETEEAQIDRWKLSAFRDVLETLHDYLALLGEDLGTEKVEEEIDDYLERTEGLD